MSDKLMIREAVEADLASLKDIYNYYVRQTHVTFDLEEVSLNNRKTGSRPLIETICTVYSLQRSTGKLLAMPAAVSSAVNPPMTCL